MKNKTIQILIVLLLIITAYMLGRLSMQEDLVALTERIHQLEVEIMQMMHAMQLKQ